MVMDTESLLPALEIDTAVPVRSSIIWLHGLGADGHDFEPIAAQLALPSELGFRFVLPHAPHRAVTINNGMNMRAWYDILAMDRSKGEDVEGVRTSAAQITALVQREQQRGVPSERIVLAGFSQGGAIALHAGLRYGQRLGGILALSTYLPLPAYLEEEAEPINADVPIFIAHGTEDSVVPMDFADASIRRLRGLEYQVQVHHYKMGHAVCMEEIQDIRAWLVKIFS